MYDARPGKKKDDLSTGKIQRITCSSATASAECCGSSRLTFSSMVQVVAVIASLGYARTNSIPLRKFVVRRCTCTEQARESKFKIKLNSEAISDVRILIKNTRKTCNDASHVFELDAGIRSPRLLGYHCPSCSSMSSF